MHLPLLQRRLRPLAFSAALLATSAASAPSYAQTTQAREGNRGETSKADANKAVELFEGSVAAYRAGDFAKAVLLLKQAYALKPAPVLVYNLARAYEGLGQLEEATLAYKEYLAKEPKPQDKGAIERRIATLEAQLAERERLRRENEESSRKPKAVVESAAAPATEDETAAPAKRSAIPWIVAGVGGAVLLGGGAVMVVAKGKHDDAKSQRVQLRADELASDARALSTTGSVLLLAGGVVLATGVVWGLLSPGRPSKTVAISPTLGGVLLRGAW